MKRISIPLMWVIAIFLNVNVFAQDQFYNTCSTFLEIKASDGSLDYKWDAAPGLQSPNLQATLITPVPPGTSTYTVRSKITEGTDLVNNGDFEGGNTGFTSEYTYYQQGTAAQIEQGGYSVTSPGELARRYNPGFGDFGDHSGPGRMLIADGASGNNGVPKQATVWKQTITVEPNTDYIFSAWMTNVTLNGVSSSLRFSINGAVIGTPASTLTQAGVWGQFYVTWNSGSTTTAEIAIAEQTGQPGGNDFAIDDIAFNKIKEIVETIQVIKGAPTDKATISGANSLCSSSTTALQASIGGGKWASSDGTVATINSTTGVITPKKVGTTQITYTLGTASCGTTVSDPFEVTVTTSATAPTVSGNHSLCMNGTLNLNSSVSGGIWTSSNTTVATIDASGKVTPISAGTTNITYSTNGSCGSAISAPFAVTVNTAPTVPAITGNNSLCLAETVNLTSSATGGTWNSSNTAVATIDVSGKVTPVSAGTTNITYTISSSCGAVPSADFPITVNALTAIPIITGDNSLCMGGTISLNSSATGGTWESSNTTVATIDASGKITPISTGTTAITYKITSPCGDASSANFPVTVNALPATPVVTGNNFLCLSSTINLNSSVTGGTWSNSNTTVATIDVSGKVTPVSAGTTNITYTLNSPCGDVTSLPFEITVNASPTAPIITGDNSLCLSSTINLTSSTTGGTWESSNISVATIDATGKITPVSAGTTNITYTLNSPCGTVLSSPFKVTVNELPQLDEIRGTANLNIGQQAPLTINIPGGTWASANETVVEIATDGTAKGLKSGESDITYTLSTPCGIVVSLPFKITVLNDDLYAPNAFTPNGDGNNDEFRIYGSAIDKIDFEIFNQWGELVYKTTDPTKGWEGTYKGEKQPAGVYIYTAKLKLIDGKEITKKGAANLIR